MSEKFLSFWKSNRQWLVSTFAMVFALGVGYAGIGWKFEAVASQIASIKVVTTDHELRLKKVEDSLTVMKQVQEHEVRIEALETLIIISREDRAKLNTTMEGVKRSIDQLLQMHLKP